jgi:serine/threonine-protein kinase
VVDEIGVGGMASVHLARMDGPGGFQKWVAIKKIHSHLVEDDSFVQMFLDEARVAAKISHPNVATVFDLGRHDDTYWIAMEYLHGEPLRELMRRTEELGTAMPPEIACRVIADAAEGLHAAHELLGKNGEQLGLVHRDVTPHNLFVTYDGVTKVVDFGIAKFSSRMSSTRAGTLKGKLAYMSPEQVHGEVIDRRTDLFALGVVLWELTTGQRLFRTDSDLDTLAKVQECNVPRPSTLIRGYPIDLEKIVMKALSKNRGERFKTAREFSRALQSLLMRRGLFIANDEVASYVTSLFADRIQKREAHLRWAAEVTQTINIAGLEAQQAALPRPLPQETTNNSDVKRAPGAPRVRPAAGAPAQAANVPMPAPMPARHRASDPPTVGPRAPRPADIPASSQAPSTQQAKAPPAAPVLAPYEEEDDHPSENDGPTIQAAPPMLEGLHKMPSPIGEPLDSQTHLNDEPPTMMGVNRAAVANMAMPGASTPRTEDLLEFDEDDDEDDQKTVVGPAARDQVAAALATPAAGARKSMPPRPVASRSNPPAPAAQPVSQPTGPRERPRTVLGLAPPPPPPTPPAPVPGASAASSPSNNMGPSFPAPNMGPSFPPPQERGADLPFAETINPNSPLNAGSLNLPASPQMQQPVSGHMQMQMGHHSQGMMMNQGPQQGYPGYDDPMRPSGQMQYPPYGPDGYPQQAPNNDGMAQRPYPGVMSAPDATPQGGPKKPPMWLVAAVSCAAALLVAGIVAVIFAVGGSSDPKGGKKPAASGSASAGAPAVGAASGAPGLFGPARAGFLAAGGAGAGATIAPPSSATVAQPTPAPSASTAAPVESAAATAAAEPSAAPAPSAQPTAQPTATAVVQPTAQPTAQPTPQPTVTAVAQPTAKPTATATATATAAPVKGTGTLTVVCLPACDQVTDNGTPLGRSPIVGRVVPAGRHTIQLSSGSVKKSTVVNVQPDATSEVRMAMSQ